MKTRLILVLLVAGIAGIVLTASDMGSPGGAPAGYTGSPGDGKNCKNCHGGNTSNTSGMITTDIPPAGYKADSTYQITVSVTGSGNKGFEVSPQNSSGTQLGTLIAGSNNHLTGGTKYVTQNAKISSSPATWIFHWKAPAAGTGNVTFYAAYCISKPVTKLENITVAEDTTQALSVTASANPNPVCLGDSTHLMATPAGGSGTYTYSWTSFPAGFTSSQQNPYAKPTEGTIYTVVVNDGTSTATSGVPVTVMVCDGINEPSDKGLSLEVYPNPVHGILSVNISNNISGGSLRLIDISGNTVFTAGLPAEKGRKQYSIGLSGFAPGLYLVRIISGSSGRTQRIIIE